MSTTIFLASKQRFAGGPNAKEKPWESFQADVYPKKRRKEAKAHTAAVKHSREDEPNRLYSWLQPSRTN